MDVESTLKRGDVESMINMDVESTIKMDVESSGVLMGGYGGVPYPPKQNFETKVLNFAFLSFGPRILSLSFKF